MNSEAELQCIRKYRHSQRKSLRVVLNLMRPYSLSSLDEDTKIRETNGYVKVTVVGQFQKVRHPLLGPQLLVLINDHSLSENMRLYLQGPNVKEFPDNAIGNVLYILDCEITKDPKDLEDEKYCLIVKMPPSPDHNIMFMLTDSSAGLKSAKKTDPQCSEQTEKEGTGEDDDEPPWKRPKFSNLKQGAMSKEPPQKRGNEERRDKNVKRIRFAQEVEVVVDNIMDTASPTVVALNGHKENCKSTAMNHSTMTASVEQTSTTPVSQTSTAPVSQTSTMPVSQTSTAPVSQTSIMPVSQTSTAPVSQTSTTPVFQTSTTPVSQTSTAPVCQTSTVTHMSTASELTSSPRASPLHTAVGTRDQACQTPPRHKKGKEELEYRYTKLGDLQPGTMKANVYGVVKMFNEARRSRGTDFFSSFRLVDESLNSYSDVQCNMFHNIEDKLPHIKAIGDVVRLHRVAVSTFNGNIQIGGKRIFSCLVFDGRPDQPIVPRTKNTEFTFTSEDKKRVAELKEWASKQSSLNSNKRLLSLQDLFPGVYFDIVCQVVSTCIIPSNECGVVKIWDGTKVTMNVRAADRHGHPSNADLNLEELVRDLCVDVVLYNNHMNTTRSLMPGQYVRMHNVHASCHHIGKDQLEVVDLCIHRGSRNGCGVTVLPMDDPDVVQMKKKLSSIQDERVKLFRCVDHRVPVVHQTSVTTVCSGHSEPFESVKTVRDCTQIPNKHKIRVKFLRVVGSYVEGLVKLVCMKCLKSNFAIKESISESEVSGSQPKKVYNSEDACPHCLEAGITSKLKYHYRIKIEVADHSERIMLLLGDKDADTFFPGLPPCNLHINQATRDQLYQRFRKLSGEEDIFSTPASDGARPFMECCIMSYYVGGSEQGKTTGRVAYKIYDTILEPGI